MNTHILKIVFATSIMFAMTNIVNAQTPQNGNKQSVEQKARAAAAKAKQEQATRDAQREAEKKQWEAEREAQREQEKYDESDRGKIESSIKKEFGEWCQKGEFEKQSDYEERLKTKSKDAFIDLCIKTIESQRYYAGGNLKLLSYDTEKEVFSILYETGWNRINLNGELKVPIAEAQDLQKKSFSTKENNYGWCFIENNLYPSTLAVTKREYDKYPYSDYIRFFNQESYIVNLQLINQKLGSILTI